MNWIFHGLFCHPSKPKCLPLWCLLFFTFAFLPRPSLHPPSYAVVQGQWNGISIFWMNAPQFSHIASPPKWWSPTEPNILTFYGLSPLGNSSYLSEVGLISLFSKVPSPATLSLCQSSVYVHIKLVSEFSLSLVTVLETRTDITNNSPLKGSFIK